MILSKLRFKPVQMSEYSMSRQRQQHEEGIPIPIEQRVPQHTEGLSNGGFSPQVQSILFNRLHTELRLMIWRWAIGDQKIHIVSKYRRLGHVVCNEEYWEQIRSERPNLRASSYMFVYGSLPTTKQLADWSMNDLLVVCRKVYDEAISILYQNNTFVFWDLRTITIFRDGIRPQRWESIRTVNIYAMTYREDDNAAAVHVRSRLECIHWPRSCCALLSLPNLRSLRIFIGDAHYFEGEDSNEGEWRGGYQGAVPALMHLVGIGANCEITFPEKEAKQRQNKWGLRGIKGEEGGRLEHQLQEGGIKCRVYSGDDFFW
ncbi:unnamed protein product [Periconia digitata]|uniref:DUF7730 domain-containing protein n=1 Tax=Periconia digitata TaxID=1303443 RepID=A0A9W4UDR3_9PLEO|nr:unnamed protein product [Periconia digitata]